MYETNYPMPVMSRKDQALRNFFSQPKFLWIGVLGLVVAFLSLFSGFVTTSIFESPIFASEGLSMAELEQITPFINIFTAIAAFIGSIPSVLIAIAYLLLHLNAKNPAKNFNAPTTILNVIATIGFVLACVFSGFIVLILILAGSALLFMPTDNSNEAVGIFVFVFLAIFYLAFIALFIFLAHVNMSYTSSLKKSTTTDELSIKGVKGYSILLIFSLISLGSSAFSSILFIFLPSVVGISPLFGIFSLVVNIISFVQILLTYQFVSGFGKIIEAEEATRRFEAASYNQPNYNNPYATPQPTEAEVVQPNLCKNCGNPVNDDDYFCMKCGTRIERD